MKKMRFLMGGLAASAILTLAACGGSDSDDPVVPANPPLAGMVADGYLVGAKICLDANGNKACDAAEKSTTTDGTGKFDFGVLTSAQAGYPLVVEVSPDTVDLDSNAKVGKAYILTAPKGSTFVSPITTLVQEHLAQNPSLTIVAAETAIKTQLGVSVGLLDDYIAKQGETNANPGYAALHRMAQVTAQLMAELGVEVKALDASVKAEVVVELVAERIAAQLTTIAGQSADGGKTVAEIADAINGSIPPITAVDLPGYTPPPGFTAAMLTSHGKNAYNMFFDNYNAAAQPPIVQEYAFLGDGVSLASSFMDGHTYVWNATDARWDDQPPMFFKKWLINAQGQLLIYSEDTPSQLLETCTLVAQETTGLRMTCNNSPDFWYYQRPTP